MRISIPHNKQKEDVQRRIDAAVTDAVRTLPVASVRVNNFVKSWQAQTMVFSLDAQAGLLKKRVHGTVEVTDTTVILDADLGFLEKLLPIEKVRAVAKANVDRLLT